MRKELYFVVEYVGIQENPPFNSEESGGTNSALQRELLTVSAIRVKIVLFRSHSHIFLVN